MDGEPSEASVVGGADRGGVSEAGPRLHCDPAGGGGLSLPALAHQRLPALPYRVVDLRGDVGAGVLASTAPVAVHGVGGDPEFPRDGLRAAHLLEQEPDLPLERFGRLAGEGFPVGPLDRVVDLSGHSFTLLRPGRRRRP